MVMWRAGELQMTWMMVCITRPAKVLIPKTSAYLVFRTLNERWCEGRTREL